MGISQITSVRTGRTMRKAASTSRAVAQAAAAGLGSQGEWPHRSFQLTRLEARLLLNGASDEVLHGVSCACAGCNAAWNATAGAESVDFAYSGSTATNDLALAASTPTGVPALSSNPSASVKLYIDFDGDYTSSWGAYSPGQTPAYDMDGNPSSFSDAERAAMWEIWARVAEKFSPFNVDVTTIDPGTYADKSAFRVVVGGTGAWTGAAYGGIAYTGGFYSSSPNTAFVFEDNLGSHAMYVAECVAHEAGHGFGLSHQSSYDANGTRTATYSTGDGLIAPIMGSSYFAQRGVWWNGTTSSANTYQDNLAILSGSNNGFGYRADDHGGSMSTASALGLSGSNLSGSGIIERMSDADYFSFVTGGGAVTFTADVAQYGAMLDLKLMLMDANGNLIASADTSSLGESLSANLASGTYYLVVMSHGGYGDLGQYTITGSAAAPTGTLAAPSQLTAAVRSGGAIELTWANNDPNATSFIVQRSTDGGVTWSDVATTSAAAFTDSATSAGREHNYRVYATDGTMNSGYSNTARVTLAPSSPTNLFAAASTTAGEITLTWNAVVGATGYRVERSLDGVLWTTVLSTTGDVTAATDRNLAAETTYFYRAFATNSAGASPASNVASATTVAAPTEPEPTPEPITAPTAPDELTATVLNKNKVRLIWNDRSNNETAFVIERSTDGVNWTFLARTSADVSTYDDAVNTSKAYHYRVSATNSAGTSGWTNVAVTSGGGGSSSPGKGKAGKVAGGSTDAGDSIEELNEALERGRSVAHSR